MRMYAASLRTRWPMRNIEYTSAPMTVIGKRSGARIATNTRSAPGVSVPVTIASHSCSWTRISVARNIPEPDHFSPNAILSLRIDRAADDREECFLQCHRPDGRRQAVSEGDVHHFVHALGFRNHVQRRPFRDGLPERGEEVPVVPAVFNRDPEGPADLPLRTVRGPLEQDPAFLDDVQPLGERLRLVEIMRRQEDRRALSGEFPEDVPDRPPRERIEADGRLVQEHEGRLRRHDGRDHRPLLLSAAQRDAEPVRDLLEAHVRERLLGARMSDLAGKAAGAEVAVHLLARREMEERLALLGHDRDERPHALRGLDDIVPERCDRAGRRDQEGRRDPEERRLARAVPAEQGDALAFPEGEGHASKRLDAGPSPAAVHLPHLVGAEGLLGHAPEQARGAYKARFRRRVASTSIRIPDARASRTFRTRPGASPLSPPRSS